jgi:serine phosphatase RsbU (regulator of sigma subunit)
VVEARGESGGGEEEYGIERLLAVVREHRGEKAAAIVNAVYADLARFGGDRAPRDDRTVVVVAYPEGGAAT